LNRSSGSPTAPTAAGTFSPLRAVLGLDGHGSSSSVLERIVTATARFSSVREATDAVVMSGVDVRESPVRRSAHEVGQELIEERDRKAVEHRRRQLPARTEVVPQAVVVEVEGGRIRTRAAGSAAGVHDAQNEEDTIAGLATLTGPTFATDPCPEPPESFRCPRRVQRLVSQMKGQAGEADAQEILGESGAPPQKPDRERWSPVRLVRTCVAGPESSASFGRLMTAEAQERHFYQASRRAFVADGAAYKWTTHAGYFRELEPVVDLRPVLGYLYSSACAVGGGESSGWSQYAVWMRAGWQGRVAEVLVELDRWQDRLGLPPSGEAKRAEGVTVHCGSR
jgi:hypothetical protein